MDGMNFLYGESSLFSWSITMKLRMLARSWPGLVEMRRQPPIGRLFATQ